MTCDPAIHHRHSIRLKGYDNAQAGAYFITLVTHQREALLSVVGGWCRGEASDMSNPLLRSGRLSDASPLRYPVRYPVRYPQRGKISDRLDHGEASAYDRCSNQRSFEANASPLRDRDPIFGLPDVDALLTSGEIEV